MTPDQQLEETVLAQLAANPDIAALKIEAYPVQPDKYRLNHAKGAVLVFLGDSRYSPAVGGVTRRTVMVLVTLLVRNLVNHLASHDLRAAIRSALFGWCPGNGWEELAIKGDRFVSESEGVWQFDLVFEVDRRLVTQYNACA